MLPCYVVFRIITVFQAPVSVPCAGMGAESAVCFASWHFASSQVARLRQEGTLCHGYVTLTCPHCFWTAAMNYKQWGQAPVSSASLMVGAATLPSDRRACSSIHCGCRNLLC